MDYFSNGFTLVPNSIHNAGIDLPSAVDIILEANSATVIPTGISTAIPLQYVGLIRGRSGLAFKHGVIAFEGTIDSSYRGEIKVLLYNTSSTPYSIREGERIAQLVPIKYLVADLHKKDVLDETKRGTNGFGSSGK